MRILMTIGTILVAGSVVGTANAAPYNKRYERKLLYSSPWCLSAPDAPYDCGYQTLQQCLVSRSGVGGACTPNPRYVAADEYAPRKTKKSKQYSK